MELLPEGILGKRSNNNREESKSNEGSETLGVAQEASETGEKQDSQTDFNRIRKDKKQIKQLVAEFSKKQTWTYADKIRISQEVGMTPHKVSKWNWDHRKKLGLDTTTKRRAVKATSKQ